MSNILYNCLKLQAMNSMLSIDIANKIAHATAKQRYYVVRATRDPGSRSSRERKSFLPVACPILFAIRMLQYLVDSLVGPSVTTLWHEDRRKPYIVSIASSIFREAVDRIILIFHVGDIAC